jgi:hypothetical protein
MDAYRARHGKLELQVVGETSPAVDNNNLALAKAVCGDGMLEACVFALARELAIPQPTAELAFHPGRRWRFDFAWPDVKVALEVEGGIWRKSGKGAHSGGAAIERDIEKHNHATLLGWRVIRAAPEDLAPGMGMCAQLIRQGP